MYTKVRVALNGVWLHSLDPSIIVQSVTENPPQLDLKTQGRANLLGSYLNGMDMRQRDVVVKFCIGKVKDPDARAAVLQKVAAWAVRCGDLSVSYRPGQSLKVVCSGIPTSNDHMKWNEPITTTFRALLLPWWQSENASNVSKAAGTDAVTLMLDGTAGGLLYATAGNDTGSTVDAVSLSCGGQTIAFSGLGLADGEQLVIDYDDMLIQRIRIKGANNVYRSAYSKRTTASADDILLEGGANVITATNTLDWYFSSFGRWLG